MKALFISVISLFLFSCSTPQVVYDYDQQINFSQFQSFAIYPDMRSGLSQLDERRLVQSVERTLKEKGFSVSEDPDLYLNIYTEEYREVNRNRLGVGVGGGGGNVGVGVSGGIPLGGVQTHLRLTFDLINAESDMLVWQAVVEAGFDFNASPEQRQKRFDQIVQQAFKKYPPEK